jgi:hypothetical protein
MFPMLALAALLTVAPPLFVRLRAWSGGETGEKGVKKGAANGRKAVKKPGMPGKKEWRQEIIEVRQAGRNRSKDRAQPKEFSNGSV